MRVDGIMRRQRCLVKYTGFKLDKQLRGVIIPQLSCRLAANDVSSTVFANCDPGVVTAIDVATVCAEVRNDEIYVRASLLPIKHTSVTSAQTHSGTLSDVMQAALAAQPSASAGAVETPHKHSMITADHVKYIETAVLVGEQREQQPEVVSAEQKRRAGVHAMAQHTTCAVASKILSASGAHYMRCHPDASVVPSPVVIIGMGGGMHKTFAVRGYATQASSWQHATRFAGRGLIVSLIDEYLTSSVRCVVGVIDLSD